MAVGKIENGLECGFVKHRLNCLLITDPMCLTEEVGVKLRPLSSAGAFFMFERRQIRAL